MMMKSLENTKLIEGHSKIGKRLDPEDLLNNSILWKEPEVRNLIQMKDNINMK